MRILVTGADGFVAAALLPLLRARGHEPSAAGRALIGDIGEDIDGATDWRPLLEGCEAVVHLANIAHRATDARALERVNVEGTRRLAEQAAASGVRRLVYLSSVKALGEETRGRPFDEHSVPAPASAYGRSKLAAERALARVAARFAAGGALEVVTLRPPLVYGPKVKANFLALMHAIARGWPLPLASLRNRRSLIYVGNLADAILRSLEAPQAAGRTYLVSDGPAVSTPELCRALGEALGRPARLFPFPARVLEGIPALRALTRSLEVDDRALRGELGWRPPFSFEEGLRQTARTVGKMGRTPV